MESKVLSNFVNGAWVASRGVELHEVRNPATGELLAETPLSTQADVDLAVEAASVAFWRWREVPAVVRARYLFKFRALLVEHAEELARIITEEHGKTLAEARGSIRRGIENVEHACGIPTLMMGDSLEEIASGIDCETHRQPLGVFAAITPFNFPAMVPLWFWPYALATGNTFVFKPSEQVPLCQARMMELTVEAGFPPGVLNMVHGAKEVVESLWEHPGIAGLSFVGSTPVARLVYENASKRGKRVQALGGAKNFLVVMPDADLAETVRVITESCYGCAGQRCLAGSVVVLVGGAYERFKGPLVEAARAMRVGNGLAEGVTLGPVVSAAHKARVVGYIDRGVAEGAELLVDGRGVTVRGLPDGHFIGATVFDGVRDGMAIATEEIFGPVIVLRQAGSLDAAVALVHESPYANATSIFTRDGGAARAFSRTVGVSMIGVNIGVAAPMAFFPFGGTKNSFFGDLKAHGKDSIRFFTDTKVVISRWP